jgi:hypothetical protein
MKKTHIMLCAPLFCAFSVCPIFGNDLIADLSSTLQTAGVSNLLQVAKASGVAPPRIPSKWHLEHRAKTDVEKQKTQQAREFGFRIVEALEEEERIQRDSFADEALFKQTMMLLDFSDWCVETAGWGNMLLANESLRLAATASIQLAANTNFPIEKCEQIISRFSPEWMTPRARAEVLNNEAGTNLFALAFVESTEELDMACGAGRYLARYKNIKPPSDTRLPPSRSLDILAAKLNFDFFIDTPNSPDHKSLNASWDYRMFQRFRHGFATQIQDEAKNVLIFRKTIGCFPEKYARSEEEQRQLEDDIKEYAKVGIKITPPEDEPSFDPLKEAFRRAWNKRATRIKGDEKVYVNAFWAYKKVMSGVYGGRESSADSINETP